MVIAGIRIKPIRVPPEAYIKITAIEQAYVYTSSSVLLLTLVTKDWQTATHPR